jgi:hypothetical protein
MPVILTTVAEVDQWLTADTADALALQRPLPDDALRIVPKPRDVRVNTPPLPAGRLKLASQKLDNHVSGEAGQDSDHEICSGKDI